MEALQVSSRYSQNSSEEFKDTYTICNEYLILDGRDQIVRMSPGFERQAQYFLEAAYEQAEINKTINVSEKIVRREEYESDIE